jgi:hypothetical protein
MAPGRRTSGTTPSGGSLDPLIVGRHRAELPDAVMADRDENLAAGRVGRLGLMADRDVYLA